MKKGVLQIIDSLNAGGAEKLAVSIANGLHSDVFNSHLCCTRKEGVLKQHIKSDIGYLFLNRKKDIDIKALTKVLHYIKIHNITIIHAHATSIYFATLIKIVHPKLKLIWHDHYGVSSDVSSRPHKKLLMCCSLFINQIISVNTHLKEWAKKNLYCKKVEFIANFAVNSKEKNTQLFKPETKKIICVAGFRPQKDHITLLKAFLKVKNTFSNWTLHLIGKEYEDTYALSIHSFIYNNSLINDVFLYGVRNDIYYILKQADIGVLSSKSEGLPIALLEYGLAKLPVVSSDVGQCAEVIGNSAVIFPVSDDEKLFEILKSLIEDTKFHNSEKERFNKRVNSFYSEEKFFSKLDLIYSSL